MNWIVGISRSFTPEFWHELRNDSDGQDLIEYALMAGFVAVAAGALLPNISVAISTIFSQVGSALTSAGS